MISCKEEIVENKKKQSIDGNWYLIENLSYSEIYFSEDKMYVYNPYSGDILTYNYYIKNNSLYRLYNDPSLTDEPYKLYKDVNQINNSSLKFSDCKLIKINKGILLEYYIKNNVTFKEYDNQVYERMKKLSDSLL